MNADDHDIVGMANGRWEDHGLGRPVIREPEEHRSMSHDTIASHPDGTITGQAHSHDQASTGLTPEALSGDAGEATS